MRRIRPGMLTPSSNTVLEPALARMAADMPGLDLHVSRFRVTRISLDEAGLGPFAVDPMAAAADLLADAEVDAIARNGTSAAWLGLARDEELCRRVAASTGVPAPSSTLAFRDPFRTMGIDRIGLVTPYTADVQDRIRATCAGAGFTCTAERHLGMSDNFAFAGVGEAAVAELVREVAAAIVCTNMRGAGMAPSPEREWGMPVLDPVAVTLWAALRLLGTGPTPLARWGRLFAKDTSPT